MSESDELLLVQALEILRTRQLSREEIDELHQLLIRWDKLGEKCREVAASLAQMDQRSDLIDRKILHARLPLQLARDGWEHWISASRRRRKFG